MFADSRLLTHLTAGVACGLAWLALATPVSALTITEYPLPTGLTNGYNVAATGPEGAGWFSLQQGTAPKRGRVDPMTGETRVSDLPIAQGAVRSMAAGPDGGLWILVGDLSNVSGPSVGDGRDLVRIDPVNGAATV